MKTTLHSSATRLTLSVASLFLLVLLATAPISRAVTITASLAMPDQTALPFGSWPRTQTNPTIGTFNFGAAAASSLPSFGGFAITIGFGNLDTDYPSVDLPPGGTDYNHLSIWLGFGANMYNTGIYLNGFTNEEVTRLVYGDPTVAGNAANIYAALQASGGQLTMQIRDSTNLPSNPFYFIGGTASMYVADQLIPFDPTQTLGFGVLAALFLFRRFPQLKRFVARA